MGDFENLERFFFNAILAQYTKIFTSCHINWSDEENPVFEEFGFNQKKFVDQVKKEQEVEDLKDYFYFYWDFNITSTVGDIWDKNLYEGWVLNGMIEQYGLDPKTPLHHRGLVSEQLKQNLTHWIRGLKNSWAMSQDDIIPIWGLYLGKDNFNTKLFSRTCYGDYLLDLPSPFYQFTQHYLLNHCDLRALRSVMHPPPPR